MPEDVAGTRAGLERRQPRAAWIMTCAAGVISVALFAGCTSAPSTTATTSAPPSGSTTTTSSLPGNDPCVVGRWDSTVGQLPQTVDSGTVTLTGGGGTLISYNRDGSYSANFSATRPYVGTASGGKSVSLSVSGATLGTFTAEAGLLSLVDTQTTLEVTLRVDGKVVSRQHPSSTTSSAYTCTPGHLTLTSGNFSTGYVTAR